MRCALALSVLLAASAARAGDNDLQLWRLGHVDRIVACTKCDGTDRTLEAGDPAAQTRFARLATALGLAFAPPFGETGGTTGQAGFELAFSGNVALPKLAADEWATKGPAGAPGPLFLPTLKLRKGLGGSVEVGAAVSTLAGSGMLGLSGEVRWAPIDGLAYVPDLALRAWGSRVLGTAELDLTMVGGDATLSKSFGVGGMLQLQPYGQFGVVLINAASGVIDFRPGDEDPRDPTADDGVFRTVGLLKNVYNRFAGGLRLQAGVVLLGAEASVAFGKNPVQSDSLPGGAVPPSQFTRQVSVSGQLGVTF